MNITVKQLEERYKVIKINKISDDVEVVDLYRAENDATYHVRLMFAFNKLFTSGYCGSFTFGKTICHIYNFFKGDNVNLGYWQEKVEASPKPLLCEDIDTDKAFDKVKKYFEKYEIECDEDDLCCVGESNMYRAYDELTELFEKYDVSDPYQEASDIVDECRDWDGQFEYICNVIQWVENNLDEWRLKYGKPCEEHYVKNCKHFNCCKKNDNGTCVGCNVWNMKYDINTLVAWCKKHSVRVFNMIENLHESLND